MKRKTLYAVLLSCIMLGACTLASDIPSTPTLPNVSLPVAGSEETWNSADYEGKPILLSIMSSGCPWCRRSIAALDVANETFAGQVEVVGVFIDDVPADVEAVQKEFQMKTKALYYGEELATDMEVNGLPAIFLFDKKHRLVKVWGGYSDTLANEYKAAINKLLK